MDILLHALLQFVPDSQCECADCVFYRCDCDCPMFNATIRVCDQHKGYWTIKSTDDKASANTESSKKTNYFY